jgi:hypothetical protein
LQGWVLATFLGMSQKLVFNNIFYMVLIKAGGTTSLLPNLDFSFSLENISNQHLPTFYLIKEKKMV